MIIIQLLEEQLRSGVGSRVMLNPQEATQNALRIINYFYNNGSFFLPYFIWKKKKMNIVPLTAAAFLIYSFN